MFINYGELCRRVVALEKLFKVTSLQVFIATAGQTDFTPTRFKATAASQVFEGGTLVSPTEYTLVNNTIVFTVGRLLGTEIAITKI